MLKKKTLGELRKILKEEFDYKPGEKELIDFSQSIISSYNLLL